MKRTFKWHLDKKKSGKYGSKKKEEKKCVTASFLTDQLPETKFLFLALYQSKS